ncbi:MAG: SCO family protein [Leptospirales bacterium]|nr:SCO family protein [Leptospirales bacterium]
MALAISITCCSAVGRAAYCDKRPAAAFSLLDSSGQQRTLQSFHGAPLLLGFAYASCRGQCPALWAELNQQLRAARQRGESLFALLITLNPERDTPAALQSVETGLDPHLRFLRGERSAVERAAMDYHVWHQKNPLRLREPGYQFEHTSTITLIDDQGYIRCAYPDPGALRRQLPDDLQRIKDHDND